MPISTEILKFRVEELSPDETLELQAIAVSHEVTPESIRRDLRAVAAALLRVSRGHSQLLEGEIRLAQMGTFEVTPRSQGIVPGFGR